jgi:CheY-like chemotaxis protein
MATILIVDDVQTDRELLGKVVSTTGNQVAYASDGDEAVAKSKQLRPALILMDIVMPNMNGFNACRKIKQDPDTSKIPVVLVSSKNTQSDVFWSKKQGADDHLGKPCTPDQVMDIVKRYVR